MRNWPWMKRGLAPTASLMPISRVRSSTTTYMMFDTPIPPTIRVKEPMIPRKARKVPKKTLKNFSASVVSHMPMASLSLGSNWWRLERTSYTRRVTAGVSERSLAWKMKLPT